MRLSLTRLAELTPAAAATGGSSTPSGVAHDQLTCCDRAASTSFAGATSA